MKVVAIANQKGGVGKTTTAVNLAAGLITQGKHVLCLDFDPQCNLRAYLGHQMDDALTITDYLFAKASYRPLPQSGGLIRHATCGIDYIPCSLALSKADMVLAQAMFRERILDDVLRAVVPAGVYDYLVIDCNPSMGILLTNALVAATDVLIPVQTEEFAVSGLEDMMELIAIIQHQINPGLRILGLLPTMVGRNTMSRDIIRELCNRYPELLLATRISRSVEAAKSTRRQQPLVGNKGKLSQEYQACTDEILQRLGGVDDDNP